MVSEKFYKFFPEYSDKLEDQNRKGKFDLTLDVRELLVNLDREQQTADYSIELYQNDFGFVGRDKYDWRKREENSYRL